MVHKKRTTCIGIILTYESARLAERFIPRIPKHAVDRLIIVDDGSGDDIARVAKKFKLPLYRHAHLGYGGNLVYGLRTALTLGADYMVEIHGDGQYDPLVIPEAIAKAQTGDDLVLGSRFVNIAQPIRDGMPIYRYVANIGLSLISRVSIGIPLTEFHSGFRVYSKKLVQTIDLSRAARDHLFSFEIIVASHFHGLTIGEIAVRCDYTREHTSIRIIPGVRFALQNFRVLAAYMLARRGYVSHPLFLKMTKGRVAGVSVK